jgi:ABC-type sugar transport system substrate-binding protein
MSSFGGLTGVAQAQASASTLKVGFSLPALDAYYSIVQAAAIKEAKAKHIALITGDGVTGASPTVQINAVRNVLAQKPKVLLISPQGTGLTPLLNTAHQEGVKIIFIDQQIPGFAPALSFIGTNNQVGSAIIGNYLVKALHGHGVVGMMLGVPGTPVSNARYMNAANILRKAGIKVVLSSQVDACVESQAIPIFRTMLQANPDMTGAYSICGPDGAAIAKVVSERPGGRKGFVCSSWDVETQQIIDMLAGNCQAAIAQYPVKLGTSAVDWAIKVANGGSIPKVINNGVGLVTAANAKCFYHGTPVSGYSYPIAC